MQESPCDRRLSGARRLTGLLAAIVFVSLAVPRVAAADPAAAKVVTAPLVAPSSAWAFYGSSTIHTVGEAALGATPPEITALADSLGADRIGTDPGDMTAAEFTRNVYDYVRNNIDVEFRFGLGKGGRGALIDGSGTPFDQAELMKSLLAEGGVSATYKVGTITLTAQEFGLWSGFVKDLNQAGQTFNIDAKSACQFLADGGIPATVNGQTSCAILSGNLTSLSMGHVWLQVGSEVYDPSYKRYTLKTGIDLPSAMQCGAEASPTCGAAATSATMSGATQGTTSGLPTITDLNETALAGQLQTVAVNLQSTIEATAPDAPVEEIVGGKTLDRTFAPSAFAALPYAGGGTAQYSWAGAVPNQFRTTYRVALATFDKTYYADEFYGRRLFATTSNSYVTFALDRSTVGNVNLEGATSWDLVVAVDHPYAAQSGTYADETTTSFGSWSGKASFVLLLGDARASRAKFAADLEAVIPEDVSIIDPDPAVGPTPAAAQFFVQETQAARLIAGITDTAITQHHILGYASSPGIGLSLSTTASVVSREGDATDRDVGFRTLTLAGVMLEGSVGEQANDSFVSRSTPIGFSYANLADATFIDIPPASFSSVSGSLSLPASSVQPFVDDGSSIIIPLQFTAPTINLSNATWTWYSSAGFLAYKAGEEGYWSSGKGGGADPNAIDPVKTVLATIKEKPAALREQFSAAIATGDVSLAPPPDLVTGAGQFPVSLPLKRFYSAKGGFDELAAESQTSGQLARYSGPDEAVYGRIGGGWVHNFQIYARIGNDGSVGMGSERAADAASAIAALVTIADQMRAPTFQSRLSSVLAANWMGRQFIGNTVSVTLPPATSMFVRRSSGMFAPPAGSSDRLVKTGDRSGPTGVSGVYDYPWPGAIQVYGVAWNYGDITLTYTRSGGDAITFTPGRWANAPAVTAPGGPVYEPLFYAQTWQFPDGVKLTFAYTTVDLPLEGGGYGALTSPRQARKLASVSNNLGRSLTFTTATGGIEAGAGFRLTQVSDETGRHVDYALTCGGNPLLSCEALSVTAPDGGVTRYEYSPDAASPNPSLYYRPGYRLRRWFTPTDATTPYMTFVYDDVFRLTATVDPLGRRTRYYAAAAMGGEPQARGEIVDPLGAESVSIFDEDGRILKAIDPLDRTTTYAYDAAGRLVLKTLPEGNAEARTYDARSNELTLTLKAKPGSGLADIVTTTTYAEGPTVTACANMAICNKPLAIDGPRTDVVDITNFTWDSATGLPTRIEQPADSAGLRPQYDIAYSTVSAGWSTVFLPGSMTQKISASSSVTTTYSWNAANKYVLQSATVDAGGLNLVTSFTFDALGNLTAVDGPLGGSTDTTYYRWDASRRLTHTILADPDGAGSLLRMVTRQSYNLDGLLVQIDRGKSAAIDGSGLVVLQTETFTFDSLRNQVQASTEAGVTHFGYDAAGRLICTAIRMNLAGYPTDACQPGTPGANGPDRITKTTYDLAGQKTSTIRAYGSPDQIVYETLTYTQNGQLQSVKDARNNLSTMQYDGFDRLCRLSFPLPSVGVAASAIPPLACRTATPSTPDPDPSPEASYDFEEYGYDAGNNRRWSRRRDGQVIYLSYDALNRETLKDVPGGVSADVYTEYDLTGRVLGVRYQSQAGAGVINTYDKAGRMVSETTFGRTMAYQYDPAGNRTRVTWPDAFYAQYDHDPLGRVTAVRENGATSGVGVLATFAYDDLGRRIGLTRGNGTTTTYGYDAADRPTALVQNVSGATYDQTYGFGWSPASQLLTRTASNALYKWTTPTPGTTSSAYDGLNRDAAIVTAGGYDARGNLTGDGTASFAYDVENRLTQVVRGGTTVTLAYDPAGRLSTMTVPASTAFLYDSDRLVAEYNASGTVLRRYVHGPGVDEPLVWYEGAGTATRRWLHADRQGSIVAWSSSSGAVSATTVYRYGPWGEPDDGFATGKSRFRYTGQIMLPEARLYFYKARVYDPLSGRFLQTDPIGYEDDLNLYAYVGEDPVNKADPTGTMGGSESIDAKRIQEMAKGTMEATSGAARAKSSGETGAGLRGRLEPTKPDVILKPGVPAPSPRAADMLACTSICMDGRRVRVTSTTEAIPQHPAGTPHRRGEAVDITMPAGQREQALQCAANCGARFQINEYDRPSRRATGGHLHLQLVPGQGGRTGPYYPE